MLRSITLTDIEELVTIENATQISPWSPEVFNQCFTAGGIGWGIEVAGTLTSFILILIQVGEAHILNVCVHPEYQHQGQGKQLLLQALQRAKEEAAGIAYLEVRISNRKAINLYKKMGFKQIGERKDYYTFNTGLENALVFAKDLQAE